MLQTANGSRNTAVDAHGCIMVRTKWFTVYKSVTRRFAPAAGSASRSLMEPSRLTHRRSPSDSL